MAVPRDNRMPENESLDALFARVQRMCSPATLVATPLALTPEAVAAAETPARPGEGSQVEESWKQDERQSLTEFTRRQFQAIRQQQTVLENQRQEILRRQNEFNETCLLRQQELNRQIKFLGGQA